MRPFLYQSDNHTDLEYNALILEVYSLHPITTQLQHPCTRGCIFPHPTCARSVYYIANITWPHYSMNHHRDLFVPIRSLKIRGSGKLDSSCEH